MTADAVVVEDLHDKLAKLRVPFEPNQIGKKPQPYKKDSPKSTCATCGGYHGMPAMHLDYVGHAAATDRMLKVDPEWTWEPLALDPAGLPALDRDGNLWIRLTILGVTRIGVGDGANAKERISDALRNAAMRFGVALDLWAKEDLTEGSSQQQAQATQPAQIAPASETVSAVTTGTFMARLQALPGPVMARAKRAKPDTIPWPVPDALDPERAAEAEAWISEWEAA